MWLEQQTCGIAFSTISQCKHRQSHRRRHGAPTAYRRFLTFEPLEYRRLLATTSLASPVSPLLPPSSTAASGSSLEFTRTNSNQHVQSADGRYVVFVSKAPNLVVGLTIPPDIQQVFRYDRVNQEVALVSVASSGIAGGNGNSDSPTISADGRRVAFESYASNLDPLDEDAFSDIYVRELDATPTTFLVSVSADGTAKGNDFSTYPMISANGTRVAFESHANNLDSLDQDTFCDIYVRELDDTPTTFLASVNADGTVKGDYYSYYPTISADGTRVAFMSRAANLDPLDRDQTSDVYVRELDDTPTTFLASVNADGTAKGNGDSYIPVLSANGTRVAFLSEASNLDPLDPDMFWDLYVRELDATPTTFLASVNADGTVKHNADGYHSDSAPTISADGTRVAFESCATNLDPLDRDLLSDVYVRELDATPTTFLASVNADGTVKGNQPSQYPVISSDGARVAFVSSASNLDPLDSDTLHDIYVRELDATPTTYLASVDTAGAVKSNGVSGSPTICADGTHVAFVSSGSNLVASDFNLSPDVMIRSVDGKTTDLASRADSQFPSSTSGPGAMLDPGPLSPGHPPTDPVQHMQSADGRYVVFVSTAPNLVAGLTFPQGIQQVYRYDQVTQEVVLISVASSGTAAGNNTSDFPTISADGTRVAFRSLASNLDPSDGDTVSDIYVRELDETPTTFLASVNIAGTVKGNGSSQYPIISANGMRVAFVSSASNLDPLDPDTNRDIYVRELDATPTTFLASVNADGTVKSNGHSDSPTISADGTRVAFASSAANLDPLDRDFFSDIYVRELDATPTTFLASVNAAGNAKGDFDSFYPTISANGKRVAFLSEAMNLDPKDRDPNDDVYVRVLDDTPTTFLASGPGFLHRDAHSVTISADGMRVAFATEDSLDPLDGYPYRDTDVYVRELDAIARLILVSVNAAGTAKANQGAFSPRISADGKQVVFVSQSTNLDPLDGDTLSDVYVRELDATPTTFLVSVSSDGTAKGNDNSTSPVISADGARVAFVSLASNLVANDFNGQSDVFVRELPFSATALDFGDAPDPRDVTPGRYPTLLESDGARHVIVDDVFLGTRVDAEEDAQPNANASGDDSEGAPDEDGITGLDIDLVQGELHDISVTVAVPDVGYLNAWIDWNSDGDWDDSNEQVFTDLPLGSGNHSLSFDVPEDAASGVTFARFRFSTSRELGPRGLTSQSQSVPADGEVEDYLLTIVRRAAHRLTSMEPLEIGQNTLVYSGAPPLSIVVFTQGPALGHTEIQGVTLDLADVEIVAFGTAWIDGMAQVVVDIPESLTGQTIYFQAFESEVPSGVERNVSNVLSATVAARQNRLDVNGDELVTAIDALIVINAINAGGLNSAASGALASLSRAAAYLDVNADGCVTPIDALIVINFLNGVMGEGESTAPLVVPARQDLQSGLTPEWWMVPQLPASGGKAGLRLRTNMFSAIDNLPNQLAFESILDEISSDVSTAKWHLGA